MKTKIGFWPAFALVVGNIIGVGIFTTTGVLAENVGQPFFILVSWLIGALYAYTGAQVYGVLAKDMPYDGGDYIYLRTYYHDYLAYLFGWAGIFITYTGSIAALGIGAAHYFNDIVPGWDLSVVWLQADVYGYLVAFGGLKLIGIVLILGLTYINYLGIRLGGGTQLALTLGIVLLMAGFVVTGLFSGAVRLVPPSFSAAPGIGDFASGLVAVLFTYMGWTTVVYIASEVENPKKNIPRALISGIIVIVLLYMAVNYVFLSVVPLEQLAGEINVASLVARVLWGEGTTQLIAVMILVAILSSLNSTILSGPRIYQAMGEDRFLWPALGKTHRRYDTPYVALWVQAGWSILLMLSGTFEQLLTIVVGAILMFSILSGSITFKVLARHPEQFRGKRLLVIIPTLIYLLLCGLILLNILYTRLLESLIGFLILLVSYPFYRYQKNRLGNTRSI